MDPIHPIVPTSTRLGPVAPPPAVDAVHQRLERERRRQEQERRRPRPGHRPDLAEEPDGDLEPGLDERYLETGEYAGDRRHGDDDGHWHVDVTA